jgi:hypothetical protein
MTEDALHSQAGCIHGDWEMVPPPGKSRALSKRPERTDVMLSPQRFRAPGSAILVGQQGGYRHLLEDLARQTALYRGAALLLAGGTDYQ